jgi:transcriptional regulator with XRE-family HTH domain
MSDQISTISEEAIGEQIRLHRTRLDITGGELATAAGLSTGTLAKIENGQISSSLSTLQSLARALNQPLSSFSALRGAA